jgi:hypothetical protein
MLADLALTAVLVIAALIGWQILKIVFYCIDVYHGKARAAVSAKAVSANRERGS